MKKVEGEKRLNERTDSMNTRYFVFSIVLLCLLFLFLCLSVEFKQENIKMADDTLAAIVYADSDTFEDIAVDVVFTEPNVIESIEKDMQSAIITANIEYQEEKEQERIEEERLKAERAKKAASTYSIGKTVNFTYDPNLATVNMDNLEERFNVFAPNDDFNKVLVAMSQMALGEAGGLCHTEIAGTVWCVLNRYDGGYANSIFTIIAAPGQYHGYSPNKAIRDDIYVLCKDVIARWVAEKEGVENVGRVLPMGYYWFYGDGKHNYFRNVYRTSEKWDWSLPTPYMD